MAESISDKVVRVCLSPIILKEKYLCSTPKIISHVLFDFFVSSKFHVFSDAEKFQEIFRKKIFQCNFQSATVLLVFLSF